jgi:hypothetical protein
MNTRLISAAVLGSLLALAPSCSGDDDAAPAPAACTGTGGPVAGEADAHCEDSDGAPVNQSVGVCQKDAADVGAAGAGGAGEGAEEEEEVRFGSSAADDDCKYDVSFTNDCIARDTPVYFTVTLKKRADDGAPATGDDPNSPEIFLDADHSHISPSLDVKAPEVSPGTYKIGPVLFDAPGRWVVRFHFFEECSDLPADSPHGHVAFYVDVP